MTTTSENSPPGANPGMPNRVMVGPVGRSRGTGSIGPRPTLRTVTSMAEESPAMTRCGSTLVVTARLILPIVSKADSPNSASKAAAAYENSRHPKAAATIQQVMEAPRTSQPRLETQSRTRRTGPSTGAASSPHSSHVSAALARTERSRSPGMRGAAFASATCSARRARRLVRSSTGRSTSGGAVMVVCRVSSVGAPGRPRRRAAHR